MQKDGCKSLSDWSSSILVLQHLAMAAAAAATVGARRGRPERLMNPKFDITLR